MPGARLQVPVRRDRQLHHREFQRRDQDGLHLFQGRELLPEAGRPREGREFRAYRRADTVPRVRIPLGLEVRGGARLQVLRGQAEPKLRDIRHGPPRPAPPRQGMGDVRGHARELRGDGQRSLPHRLLRVQERRRAPEGHHRRLPRHDRFRVRVPAGRGQLRSFQGTPHLQRGDQGRDIRRPGGAPRGVQAVHRVFGLRGVQPVRGSDEIRQGDERPAQAFRQASEERYRLDDLRHGMQVERSGPVPHDIGARGLAGGGERRGDARLEVPAAPGGQHQRFPRPLLRLRQTDRHIRHRQEDEGRG